MYGVWTAIGINHQFVSSFSKNMGKASSEICLSTSFLLIATVVVLFCFPSTMAKLSSELPFPKTTIQPNELETYIVHVELPDDIALLGHEDVRIWYGSFLPEPTDNATDFSSRMVYSYRNVFTGFAAKLSTREAKAMERVKGFISARPDEVLSLHTTLSPSFMGLHLHEGPWLDSNYGENVIIGLVDSGITPGHPSFDDEGVPPPPAKWKGKCELNGIACNNKLIGARSFVPGLSPVDVNGHGTHTSSTAAGTSVKQAGVFGQAKGTAVGMAPRAHIAMYRACRSGCLGSSVLAAMDAAIADGVDILSISLGARSSSPFDSDAIAIGAYGAMRHGVLVSCSAGNLGPDRKTLSNEAPWILTVGASTLDRTIKATAVLGNKESYNGQSLNQSTNLPPTLLPLFYSNETAFCGRESFKYVDVKGKVVLCEDWESRISKGKNVKNAGGAAMILANIKKQGETTFADHHVLPAMQVGYQAGRRIKHYIRTTNNPVATIHYGGTVIGDRFTPVVADFSSRGPNRQSPGILKPDIIGPGVNILAAWNESVDNVNQFEIESGTSMSCPHISGIAALIKRAHPDWSPAAIKSAIMTTALQLNHAETPILDERLQPANVFAIGAGHVNPLKALDPGLIYDIQPEDYIAYLCGLGYSDTRVYAVTNSKVNCSKIAAVSETELNYPSFALKVGSKRPVNQTYSRTLTNVGPANSTYVCSVVLPYGVDITCAPQTLYFSEANQKLTFQVTFSWSGLLFPDYVDGSLAWKSTTGEHIVNVPIAVTLE